MGVFNKTIILLALVGYEMIIISYPTRPRGIIVKCIIQRLSDSVFVFVFLSTLIILDITKTSSNNCLEMVRVSFLYANVIAY